MSKILDGDSLVSRMPDDRTSENINVDKGNLHAPITERKKDTSVNTGDIRKNSKLIGIGDLVESQQMALTILHGVAAEAAGTLIGIMRDTGIKEAIRLKAAVAVLDRTGNSVGVIEGIYRKDNISKSLEDMSVEELQNIVTQKEEELLTVN